MHSTGSPGQRRTGDEIWNEGWSAPCSSLPPLLPFLQSGGCGWLLFREGKLRSGRFAQVKAPRNPKT